MKPVNYGRDGYCFKYTFDKKEVYADGFKSFNDALVAFAVSRIQNIEKLTEEFKDVIDQEAYKMLKSISVDKYIKILFGLNNIDTEKIAV